MQFSQIITAMPLPLAPPESVAVSVTVPQDSLPGFDLVFDLLLGEGAVSPDLLAGAVQTGWPPPVGVTAAPLAPAAGAEHAPAHDGALDAPSLEIVPDAPVLTAAVDQAVLQPAPALPSLAKQMDAPLPQGGLALPVRGDVPLSGAAPPVKHIGPVPAMADELTTQAEIKPAKTLPQAGVIETAQTSPAAAPPLPMGSRQTTGETARPANDAMAPPLARATVPSDADQRSTPFPVDAQEPPLPAAQTPPAKIERQLIEARFAPAKQGLAPENIAQPLLPWHEPATLLAPPEPEAEQPQQAKMMPVAAPTLPVREIAVAAAPAETVLSSEKPGVNPVAPPDDAPLLPLPPPPQSAAPVAHSHPAVPSTVTQQISQAVQITLQSVQTREGERVELSLAPEELGRIQFDLATKGDALRLTVYVERPETLDLIRRHADQLLSDLRNAGFGQTTLDMGGWGQREQQATTPAFETKSAAPFSEGLVAQTRHDHASAPIDGRLDLRL